MTCNVSTNTKNRKLFDIKYYMRLDGFNNVYKHERILKLLLLLLWISAAQE